MQMWMMISIMLIQQLLPVVSKRKLRDSLLNSFFACLFAEPIHLLLLFMCCGVRTVNLDSVTGNVGMGVGWIVLGMHTTPDAKRKRIDSGTIDGA